MIVRYLDIGRWTEGGLVVPPMEEVLGEEGVVEVLENGQWRLHADWRHLHHRGRRGRNLHGRHGHLGHRSHVVAPSVLDI